jgi:hypothetical protein
LPVNGFEWRHFGRWKDCWRSLWAPLGALPMTFNRAQPS